MNAPLRLGTALVTGASSAIGQAIARALAPGCDRLLLHHHTSAEAVRALADDLSRSSGSEIHGLRADLTDASEIARLAAEAAARAPRLDLLVHNAGLYHRAPLGAIEPADADRLYALNQRAPLLLTQALLGPLRAARGQVVLLADVGGVIPWRFHAAYGATKAAVAWMVRALALELAPEIRVNGVAPGLITLPEGLSAEERERLVRRIPMRRPGAPEEVAEAVRWFALGAGYVTGQVLSVDGGRSAGRAD